MTRDILVIVAIIVIVAVAIPLVLKNYCTGSEIAENPPSYNLSIEGSAQEEPAASTHKKPINAARANLLYRAQIQAKRTQQPGNETGSQPDRWSRRFWCETTVSDYLIVLFTLALVGVTYLLWRSTDKLWAAGERQIEIASRQMTIQGLQADILIEQKEIARLQFFAEHRPRIVLKDVYFAPEGGALHFELANIGGSGGKITGGFVALDFVSDERQFKDSAGRTLGNAEGVYLSAGELRTLNMRPPAHVGAHIRFPGADRINVLDVGPQAPRGPLYFFGAITYVDDRGIEFGVERLSVFRRQRNNASQRFQRTGDPDHEYAD